MLLILQQFTSVKELDATIKTVRALRRFDSRQFVSPMEPAQISDVIAAAWPGGAIQLHSSIYELTWPEGWRVLIRRSGTESLTRCYVEGPEELYDWFSDKVSK